MVFVPFRLRNQKWDTYHFSGAQLWLGLAARVHPWPSAGARHGQHAGSALLRNEAVHTVLPGPRAVSCLVYFAQSARSCRFTLGWCGRRSQRINLTQAVSRQKEWLLRVLDNGEERLRSMKSCRDVIHDASNLLDVRPACVVELSVARFARTKDQKADGTWSRKHSVHGLVAQKRRAGVLATAGARAWPTLHARGRAVCRTVRMRDADYANLPKHT